MENILEGLFGFQILDEKDRLKEIMMKNNSALTSDILKNEEKFGNMRQVSMAVSKVARNSKGITNDLDIMLLKGTAVEADEDPEM